MAQGTIDDPMTLAEAMTSDRIQPGHTVWLRGGTYTLSERFAVILAGTAEQPITVRAYPGEAPIINMATLDINGAHLIFQDVVIYSTAWNTRYSEEGGTSPSDIIQPNLNITGAGASFINCVIHDTAEMWLPIDATGLEIIYGNLIFHTGWDASDTGHGPCIYVQNTDGLRTIRHNVLFNTFTRGFQARSDYEGYINHLNVDENIFFNIGGLRQAFTRPFYMDAPGLIENVRLTKNLMYNVDDSEWWPQESLNCDVSENYSTAGWLTRDEVPFHDNQLNVTGTGTVSALWPNEYDATRAILTVYNWDNLDTAEVDVSAWLEAGQQVRVRSVQDYFVDIATLTVGAEGTLAMDMRAASHSVAAPVGWEAGATTFPTFGCWILEKLA